MGLIDWLRKKFGEGSYRVGTSQASGDVVEGMPITLEATIQKLSTKGVGIGEVLWQNPNIPDADIWKANVAKKRYGIDLGLHGPLDFPLTSATREEYGRAEKLLKDFIDFGKKLGVKYINFHASSSMEIDPLFAHRRWQRRARRLVAPSGKDFVKILEGKVLDRAKEIAETMYPAEVGRIKERVRTLKADDKGAEEEIAEKEIKKAIKDLSEAGELSELFAYRLVAWKMYYEKDRLWMEIVGRKSPKEAENDDEWQLVVNAVAARYVAEHLKKHLANLALSIGERLKNVFRKPTFPKYKIKKKPIKAITIEPPKHDVGRKDVFYRLARLKHLYYAVKAANEESMPANEGAKLLVDFEHLADQGLNVDKEVDDSPSGVGHQIYALHVGMIPTHMHKHVPIQRGYLGTYVRLYKLRKKGMRSAIFIFERGGGLKPSGEKGKGDSAAYRDVLTTLRSMAKYLAKDQHPDYMPEEFFGITKEEMEHEKRMAEEHAFDHLAGMLWTPELKHTWFGKEATEKAKKKPEEWKREEFR